MVSLKQFREDLYYRVSAEKITLPALRDRAEDIPMLAEYFLSHDNKNRVKRSLSKKALDLLTKNQWPGNVREFKNLMQSLVLNSPKPIIHPSDLPEEYHNPVTINIPSLSKHEKSLVVLTLKHTSGNKSDAATILGVSRNTIYSLIRKHTL